MKRFVLTEQVEADINQAWEYVAESNLDATVKLSEELYAAMQKSQICQGRGNCGWIWQTNDIGSGSFALISLSIAITPIRSKSSA